MAVTDVLQLPTPDDGDGVDIPVDLKQLADKLEDLLVNGDLNLWTQGDFKISGRTADHGRWLRCDGRELTQAQIESALGLDTGAAADFVTWAGTGTSSKYGDAASGKVKIPETRGKFALGSNIDGGGTSRPLKGAGSSGGAETVTLTAVQSGLRKHTHGAGSYASASHFHGEGTLSAAGHSHGDGTLAAASHSHGDGTLSAADHNHSNGTLAADSHSHGPGSLVANAHSHGDGSLTAAGHAHGAGSYRTNYSSNSTLVFTASGAANVFGHHAGEVDPSTGFDVAVAMYVVGTSDSASADVTGSTGSAGAGVSGSTDASGSLDVSGSTSNSGALDVSGATASVGADVTGSTGTSGADVTGDTATSGPHAVSGVSGDTPTYVAGGLDADDAHENMPPFVALGHWFIRV